MIDIMERHVLKDETWSAEIATRRATQHFTFQGYCATLVSWVQTSIEKGDRRFGDLAKSPTSHGSASAALVHFGEHYTHPRNNRSGGQMGSRSKNARPERKGTCYCCGKRDHFMAECPAKGERSHIDALKARVRDAGGGVGGTTRVLFELGVELDTIAKDSEGHEEDNEPTSPADHDQQDSTLDISDDSNNFGYEEFFVSEQDAVGEVFFPLGPCESAGDTTERNATNILTSKCVGAQSDKRQSAVSQGAAIDTGAQRSIIGVGQAEAYCKASGSLPSKQSQPRLFRFGDGTFPSLGTLRIGLPTSRGLLTFDVDIVSADVPLLLGLDVLDGNRLQVLSVSNRLQHVPECRRDLGWSIPLVRKYGHAYLVWNPRPISVNFSRAQLEKVHNNLYHASAGKTLELLKRASSEAFPDSTRAVLEYIPRKCHTCQRYADRPTRFRIRVTDDVVFNNEVRLDLMFVEDWKAVLHAEGAGTNFQPAVFAPKEDSATVWNCFLVCWVHCLAGFPRKILVDQGTVFSSHEFKTLCASNEVELRRTGVESHPRLRSGETHHHPLRRLFQKVAAENPTVPRDVVLSAATHAMNGTANPKGMVPALLVFGMIPKVPSLSAQPLLANSERLRLLTHAREEYDRIVSQNRVQ